MARLHLTGDSPRMVIAVAMAQRLLVASTEGLEGGRPFIIHLSAGLQGGIELIFEDRIAAEQFVIRLASTVRGVRP